MTGILSAPQHVESPLTLWCKVYAVCANTWRHHEMEKKLVFLVLAFWLKILPHLNTKAVHNLETQGLSIILAMCQFPNFYYFWFLR